MKIAAINIINSKNRNSTVDIFRGIAIILVVIFHFPNALRFGYIGVDLFFVISGLLVGGLLIKKYKDNENITFFKFFLQRGFKIWPSYFTFLLLGIPLAYFLYRETSPDQLMGINELPKYLFFYKNYSINPNHYVFDQAWSLCVEEHFYIILPITFLLLIYFKLEKKFLLITILTFIAFGIIIKFFINHSSSFGTHARIDALAWGVLLNYIITYHPLKWNRQYLLSFLGLGLLFVIIFLNVYHNSYFYERVIYHSLLPVTFFLMILGLYNYNIKSLRVFRFVGYYSYNWYLWHIMFIGVMVRNFGSGLGSLICYMLLTFTIAIFFTVVVEERFLERRNKVLKKIFKEN